VSLCVKCAGAVWLGTKHAVYTSYIARPGGTCTPELIVTLEPMPSLFEDLASLTSETMSAYQIP